jgi:hypothetical protein
VKEHWSTPAKQPAKAVEASREYARALTVKADELRDERARAEPPADAAAEHGPRADAESALREFVQHLATLVRDARERPAGAAPADWQAACYRNVNGTAMRALKARRKLADLGTRWEKMLDNLPIPEAAVAAAELAGLVRKHWAKPAKQPPNADKVVCIHARALHAKADELRGERTAPPPELAD